MPFWAQGNCQPPRSLLKPCSLPDQKCPAGPNVTRSQKKHDFLNHLGRSWESFHSLHPFISIITLGLLNGQNAYYQSSTSTCLICSPAATLLFPSLERSPGKKTMTQSLSYSMSLICTISISVLSWAVIVRFPKTWKNGFSRKVRRTQL